MSMPKQFRPRTEKRPQHNEKKNKQKQKKYNAKHTHRVIHGSR